MRIHCFLLGMIFLSLTAQADSVPFDDDRWVMQNARLRQHLGRTCLTGFAFLQDVDFENGVIEVDIASAGARSYPGLIFRMQSALDYERFYIRPHCANGFFYNALQYTPAIRGVAGWQLYCGDGFTGPLVMPRDEWVHVKMEIHGSSARVFVGNMDTPALVIPRLQHGVGKGAIGLMGENNTAAYFSNFSFRHDDSLVFEPVPEEIPPLGMIMDWELSRTLGRAELDLERAPTDQGLDDPGWTPIQSAPSGLVDVCRHRNWQPGVADWVMARAVVKADQPGLRKFWVGYSDQLYLYVNGRLHFFGDSAYRSRDPGFAGIIGLKDAVYLPLDKGENELLFLVAEGFGGWGFLCRDGEARIQDPSLTRLWEVARGVDYPESVCYDEKRDRLYVSHFFNNGNEYISRRSLDGEIIDRYWITGLNRPTGLCLVEDTLYVVERTHLVEIDLHAGNIKARHKIPSPGFANDVSADSRGTLYISDGQKNLIYGFQDGRLKTWLRDPAMAGANGLCVHNNQLLVGCSGDGSLKTVDLASQEIRTVVSLGAGAVMDGVQSDGKGNFLLADHNGRLVRVTPEGAVFELLNTTALGINLADLAFIPEKNLLVIPGLMSNRLTAYSLSEGP